MTTAFSNSANNGTVTADGFISTGNAQSVIPNLSIGQITQVVSVVAAAGATQGTATQIPSTGAIINVTVTASTEGVKLPTAGTGKTVVLLAPTTKGFKSYGNAAGQLINSNTTATTAFALTTAQAVTFYGVDATHWRAEPVSTPGSFSTLTATGLATLSGGVTVSGAQKETVTVVAAAGATQGTATAIAAGAATVVATVTASTEGVKLPTAATSRVLNLIPPNTIGLKVYGGAAGQLINAGTTATTAYLVTSGRPVIFYGIDATHWRAQSVASFAASTLSTTGLATLNSLSVSGATTLSQTLKNGVQVLAAAGATQGTAGVIASTAVVVQVTLTTSTEGVKLPTASTGRQITVLADTAHSFRVYGGAAGQSINAATTATTAVVIGTNKSAVFYGISATKWKGRVA